MRRVSERFSAATGWRAWLVKFGPVFLPMLLLVVTGLRGLDFGTHWDERSRQIEPTKLMVDARTPYSEDYSDPILTYWLNLAVALPAALTSREADTPLKQQLESVLDSRAYVLRVRAVYLVVGALTLFWTYALVLQLGGAKREALLAASLIGCSWEVAYHLRWIGPETLLMQFAALTALLAVVAVKLQQSRWFLAAALAAGLSFASKRSGGLLLLPVIAAALSTTTRSGIGPKVLRVVMVLAVFAAVFVVLTPALLPRWPDFSHAILSEIRATYGAADVENALTRSGAHLWDFGMYVSTVLFSPYAVIALPAFLTACVGVWRLAKRDRRIGVVLFAFPAVYVIFVASQRTILVRDFLPVVPFLALAAAHGCMAVGSMLRSRRDPLLEGERRFHPPQILWIAAIAAALCVNAAWLIASAESIIARKSGRFVREAIEYMRSHPSTTFELSPRVTHDLLKLGALPENVRKSVGHAQTVMLYAREGMSQWTEWPKNFAGLTRAWFGPREVNFNFYPGWWGDDRIVVVDRDVAQKVSLLVAGRADELPVVAANVRVDLAPPHLRAERSTSSDTLQISWRVPSTDPRVLVSRAEAEDILGPLTRGPVRGGWELDGRGCTFVARDGAVATLVVMSTGAFELERSDPRSTPVLDAGLFAYEGPPAPSGDLRMLRRSERHAVFVHFNPASRTRAASLESASQLLAIALQRLDAIDAPTN